MPSSQTPAADLQKLEKQRVRLQASIDRENDKETVRFGKVTWGHGMRHSKLPNTSARLDDLEYKMTRLERTIVKATRPA